jgi:peptide chain release factor 2
MLPEEIRPALTKLRSRLVSLRESLDLDRKCQKIGELELQMNSSDFWDNPDNANAILRELKTLKELAVPWEKAQQLVEDSSEMFELAELEKEMSMIEEVGIAVEGIIEQLDDLDIKSLLRGEYDASNVYFTIQAGAGGTESCDWAHMLYRMYDRFFSRNGYKTTTMEVLPGDGAGIKSVSIKVEGPFAYGYLRSEMGVHRLVRISPFDSQNRRHTSFVSVDVTPDLDEELDIEINPKEIRIDTYRASGAGGQHVNKTDSAVRITHEPTNIVVQCQSERSQISNKATCMKMLKAKLWQYEEQKRQDELSALGGTKSSIGWGSQIRSYVLQPYQMIKDHRTDHEMGNVQAVLDGDILSFLKKFLEWNAKNHEVKS